MLEHLASVSEWVLSDSTSSTTLESLILELLSDFGGGVLALGDDLGSCLEDAGAIDAAAHVQHRRDAQGLADLPEARSRHLCGLDPGQSHTRPGDDRLEVFRAVAFTGRQIAVHQPVEELTQAIDIGHGRNRFAAADADGAEAGQPNRGDARAAVLDTDDMMALIEWHAEPHACGLGIQPGVWLGRQFAERAHAAYPQGG